jgi:hypothetical protein
MTNVKVTEAISKRFLENSDSIYTECAHGIHNLDKIIVSVASGLSDQTRSYLVPILYAYWERFFTLMFTEFFSCLTVSGLKPTEFNEKIFRFRVRREMMKFSEDNKIKEFHEIANSPLNEIPVFFTKHSEWLEAPIQFIDPVGYVNTESNVGYKVLEKNCKRLGLEITPLSKSLADSKYILFKGLTELLDARNSIAHGEAFKPMDAAEWEELKGFVLCLMNCLQMELYSFMGDETKLLVQTPTTALVVAAP